MYLSASEAAEADSAKLGEWVESVPMVDGSNRGACCTGHQIALNEQEAQGADRRREIRQIHGVEIAACTGERVSHCSNDRMSLNWRW